MNIDYTKNEDNTAQIEVTVEPQDYKDTFESELRQYQKKANLKGFRKGKTPKSIIQKMYGPSLLMDVVTKKLQDALNDYLEEEKLEIFGQPIPSEDQAGLDFKAGEELSYSFKFDVGLKPDFEIAGLDDSYHYFDTTVSEEEIDKQIENLRRRQGTRESIETDFEKGDIITFNARELDDDEVKRNGLETTFEIMVEMMGEELKEKVVKASIGELLDFDIYKADKNATEEDVRKYLMNLEEDELDREVNAWFRGEIVEAKRWRLAELDEELLTTAFGDDVKTEDQAREIIKKDIKDHFDDQADSLLFQEVHDKMMADTQVNMPDDFLKRWMFHNQSDNGNESQPVSFQEIEDEYENHIRKSLRWQLISDKLSAKYEVTVEKEEILEVLGRRIQQYMPGQQLNNEVYNQILQSLAQDKDQVQNAHDQVRTSKIFKALKEDLNLDKEVISQEDFERKLKELAEEQQKGAMIEEDYDSGEDGDEEE